jgi:hypothetical protein
VELWVREQQRSAPSSREQFRPTEAQHSDIAPRSCRSSLYCCTWCLGGIFHHSNTTLAGNLHHFPHGNDASVQMRADDGFGLGGDRRNEVAGIEIPVVRGDINQDGLCTNGVEREKIGLILIRSHHNFVTGANAKSSQCGFHGKSAACAGDGVGDAVELGEFGFQRADVFSVVLPPHAGSSSGADCSQHIRVWHWPYRRTSGSHRRPSKQRWEQRIGHTV